MSETELNSVLRLKFMLENTDFNHLTAESIITVTSFIVKYSS